VNQRLAEWKDAGGARRAGVSSFGIGGTNAHVILQEAPTVERSGESRPWQMLVISAKTPTALDAASKQLADQLRNHPTASLADIAYTLKVGRARYAHRRMLLCRDIEEGCDLLNATKSRRVFTSPQDPVERSVVFLLPDRCNQGESICSELYHCESAFRGSIDECREVIQSVAGVDLLESMEGSGFASASAPARFAAVYGMARFWMSWGVVPVQMIASGVGQYVAACLAGVLSIEHALALVIQESGLLPSFRCASPRFNPAEIPFQLASPRLESCRSEEGWRGRLGEFASSLNDRELDWVPAKAPLLISPIRGLTIVGREYNVADAVEVSGYPTDQVSDDSYLPGMLNTLGQLWISGVRIDWRAFYRDEQRQRIALPTYPFENRDLGMGRARRTRVASDDDTASQPRSHPHSQDTPRAVPDTRPSLANKFVAPQTRLEQQLVDIWSAVLGIDGIGVFDSLFELGGDSLVLTQIVSRVRAEFDVRIPINELFLNSTVSHLAALVESSQILADAENANLEMIVDEVRGLAPREIRRQLHS
jgi:acyl transferase domain-containing protein